MAGFSSVYSAFLGALGGSVIAGIVIGSHEIKTDLDSGAKDTARKGVLTVETSCTEQAKTSQRIQDYFTWLANKHGKENLPVFVMSKEDCIRFFNEKNEPAANAPAP
ncbi:MAG: hypothetical protein HYU57_04115 [Micavibrio aeruginosavorus]|nr:hypothetical protein [Micavibrio aeruginosavorus]